MAQQTEGPPVHHDGALDHLEEEIKELEGVTWWGPWFRWGGLTLLVAAIVAGTIYMVTSPPPTTSGGKSHAVMNAATIELREPRGMIDALPSHFAWESVTGRLQYVVRIFVQGASQPVLERIVTSPFLDLSPDDQKRLVPGRTHVWTVTAQAKDGSTMGAGQATFKVR